jgi:glycosyltransferase involved in cell wall biosynthesis
MSPGTAAFAVPGDLQTTTGGYIYDRTVLEGLRDLGWSVEHIPLGASFPEATPQDMADAARRLSAVDAGTPLIIDGLAMGALDPEVLAGIRAPIIALVHHPLAHESGLSEARRTALHGTEQANLARAAAIIVTSPHTADLLVRDYAVDRARITIALPGTKSVAPTAPLAETPLILSVGILVPRKGHDVLLRALATLTDLPWRAVIVGEARDAAHAEALGAMAVQLGLAERLHFAGRVPDETLARLYAEAHVFALATRYEGYGIVFNEAMAQGLPIVTCAVGAVPDTVAPEAGLLTEKDDPAAFAAALRRVLEDAELAARLARASARAGAALSDWTQTTRTFEGVLDHVRAGENDA